MARSAPRRPPLALRVTLGVVAALGTTLPILAHTVAHARARAARTADVDLVAAATDALERGEEKGALRLVAKILRERPAHGEALYVLGVISARRGRPEDALRVFERAEEGTPRPDLAMLAFRKAEAFEALGRNADAEEEFLTAAVRSRPLAPTALASAAFAALADGRPDRARAHARKARRLDAEGELRPLLKTLDAQIAAATERPAAQPASNRARREAPPADPAPPRRGDLAADEVLLRASRAYREGRYAEAATAFHEAAALDPDNPEPVLMEGLARYKLGDAEAARDRFQQALALGLRPEDRALARTYIDALSLGDAGGSGGGFTAYLIASLGGGYDTNVSQVSARDGGDDRGLERAIFADGGAFATASAIAGVGRRFGRVFSTELGYNFYQTVYSDPEKDDYNAQDHGLEWLNTVRPTPALRLRLTARAGLSFTGLRTSFALFERSAGLEPDVAYELAPWNTVRLAVTGTVKRAVDPAYAQFNGTRLDLLMSDTLNFGGWMLTLTLRHRREDVGVREETNRPDPTYMGPCADCDVDSIVPYSYRSNSIGLRASSPFGRRVRLGLSGRAEDRPYALPSYLEGRRPGEAPRAWDFRRRHDRRYTAGGDFSVRITDAISVVLRYSAALSQSNVRGGWRDRCEDFAVCHPLDFDDRNYVKHLASLELEASWF